MCVLIIVVENELPKKEKIDIDVNVIGSGILPELTPLQELEVKT